MLSPSPIQLIRLVLSYLVMKDPEHRIYVDHSTERLHTLVHHVQMEFGHLFLELRSLHFQTQGAFPYSSELSDVMSNLVQTGKFEGNFREWKRIAWYPDSEKVITEELEEFWAEGGEGENIERNFITLAERFRVIVKGEEEIRSFKS